MTHAEPLPALDYGAVPQSDAAAQAWLERQRRRCGPFIGGRRVRGSGYLERLNPATGELLAQVAQTTPALVERAVQAAAAAQPAWWKLGGPGRARCLQALARALQQQARLFAVLETLDSGRPIRVTGDVDVPVAARHFDRLAGWAQLLDAEFPQHQALGVVGAIQSWHSPLPMLAAQVAPALACGNTVVVKPSRWSTLSALLLAAIGSQAGLPAGVLNVVTGDDAVGEAIVADPRVASVTFAGRSETGRALRRAGAGSGRHFGLAIVAPPTSIVFADADLDAVVEGLVEVGFLAAGPPGTTGSALLVHEGMAQALVALLQQRMARIRVGDLLDVNTDLGVLPSPAHRARLDQQIEAARTQGASIHQACATPLQAGASFFPPTLVTGAESASDLLRDNASGPVLTLQTFRTPGEALEMANHARVASTASVWTESVTLALDVAPRLLAGTVWVNAVNPVDAACFSGDERAGLLELLRPRRAPRRTTTRARTATAPPLPRQDIGRAVAAARAALAWERSSAEGRAQVLYRLAEQLVAQRSRLVGLLAERDGKAGAETELQASVECLNEAAARAGRGDGAVGQPPRALALTLRQPLGVVGIVAPDTPSLLGLLRLLATALAPGNRVVLVPSAAQPPLAAELGALFDRAGLPAGALVLAPGRPEEQADTLAAHHDVDALWWPAATDAQAARADALAAGNLKRTRFGQVLPGAEDRLLFEHSTRSKILWLPAGL